MDRQRFPHWILPFGFALCAYGALAIFSFAPGRLPLGIWWAVQAAGWISCAWFLRAVASGWPALGWILASALAFRLCGLWVLPTLEDDYQRYLWDGWRTIQGSSPYARAPLDYFAIPEKRPAGVETALNELNHPALTTIYAPVTQLLFAAAATIAPGSLFTLKLLLICVDFAVILLLAAIGGRRAAWFYGWCPLAVTETAFHAHPEAWALLWLLAAWFCASRRRYLCAGALLGLAVGAKIFALLAVPFLVWRRPAVVFPAFLAALGCIYVPIFAAGSSAEWSGVRAMAGSFEFNSFGFALLAAGFGSGVARFLWWMLFGAVAAALFARWVWQRRGLEDTPVADIYLLFFLLAPVLNPWYLLWLLPFAATRPSRRHLTLLAVVPLSYATGLNLGDSALAPYAQPGWVRPIEFGIFLLTAGSGLRWKRSTPWR